MTLLWMKTKKMKMIRPKAVVSIALHYVYRKLMFGDLMYDSRGVTACNGKYERQDTGSTTRIIHLLKAGNEAMSSEGEADTGTEDTGSEWAVE